MHDTVEKKEFYYLIGWMEQSQEALLFFLSIDGFGKIGLKCFLIHARG